MIEKGSHYKIQQGFTEPKPPFNWGLILTVLAIIAAVILLEVIK